MYTYGHTITSYKALKLTSGLSFHLFKTQLRIDSFFRMEQQESQQIQSQRLRRAVTCMKRKEREEAQEEEEEDEDMKGTKKGRPGRSEQNREPMSCSVAFEGGFMGSEGTGANSGRLEEPVGMDCKSTAPTPKVKTQESVQKNCPQKAVLIDSSSSDSDSESGWAVPMVTAQSVFNNKPQRKGRRGGRGKGRSGP